MAWLFRLVEGPSGPCPTRYTRSTPTSYGLRRIESRFSCRPWTKWHLRREQAETGRVQVSRARLNCILPTLPRAKGYYSMSARLTRDEVIQAWRSFFALRRNGHAQYSAPGFRPKSMLSPLKYVQSGFKVEGDRVTLSLGTHRQDGIRHVAFRISHRLIKTIRRYWQKVRSKVTPPSKERPRMSRRYREIAHSARGWPAGRQHGAQVRGESCLLFSGDASPHPSDRPPEPRRSPRRRRRRLAPQPRRERGRNAHRHGP